MKLISKISETHILIFVLFLLLMPFPTEMVPEWKMQVVDDKNQPLVNVRTEQNWQSYTYFFTGGYESRCTDSKGIVIFPKRDLWAGTLSRIVSPLWASVMTLAHGSKGTDAHIQVFDNDYSSYNYYWGVKAEAYTKTRGKKIPSVAIAARIIPSRQGYDCK